MTEIFRNIWKSSEEKMQMASKITLGGILFEDTGILEVSPPLLVFHGEKQEWRISNVYNLSLFQLKQFKSIQTIIIVLLATITIITVISSIVTFRYFVSDNSLSVGINILLLATHLALLSVVGAAWFIHFSSIGPLGSSRWIKVSYLDGENQLQTIYFADGSKIGWGGKMGGTQRIYVAVQQAFASGK